MSKVNMMSAKDKKKGSQVPRLRFPEFNGEWRSQPLGELAFIIKEKAGDRKCILMSIMSGVGLIPQIDKFGKEIAGQQYKNYIILHKNDFAYNKSSTKEYPEGFIAMYIGTEIAAVPNSIFTCFKIKVADIAHLYLNYLFLYNFHGKYLRRYITIGARSHGALAIDDADLLSLPIPYPTGNTSFKEQQRIADCLSSLDERIAAETNKLDALKAHKKGLLKQLFPAEGETLPALRFPKFRNAGEWEKSTVNDLLTESCQIGSKGNKAKKLTVKLWGKGVFEKEEIFQGSVNTQYYRRRSGQFIYSKLDFLNQAFGIIPHYLDGFESTVDLPCFDFRSDVNPIFFLEYVKREAFYKKFGEIADGGRKAKRIQVDVFLSFPVLLPPQTKEQQQIADCLSSLDELITAQGQKIELLKDHKKGLMQQLFPRIDEVLA